MLRQVVEEMMRNAAEQIGYEHNEGNIGQLLKQIQEGYDIQVNFDGPITWQILNLITNEVKQWQTVTKENFM